MRVVGTLTTMPGREVKLLHMLKSINNQDRKLDVIYLTVPESSRRLGITYPNFSDEIKSLCTIVRVNEDYGPITKIVGALLKEEDPDTIIFSFDDDVIYPSNIVSKMLEYNKQHPDAALCSNGILIKLGFPLYAVVFDDGNAWNDIVGFFPYGKGREVDIIFGYASVLYVRKFFPTISNLYDDLLKYPLMDDNVFYNDDVMISAYLSGKKIKRLVFSDIPHVNNVPNQGTESFAICSNKFKFVHRLKLSIDKVTEWGFFEDTANVNVDETIAGNVWIGAVLVFLIFLACLAIMYYIYLYWF